MKEIGESASRKGEARSEGGEEVERRLRREEGGNGGGRGTEVEREESGGGRLRLAKGADKVMEEEEDRWWPKGQTMGGGHRSKWRRVSPSVRVFMFYIFDKSVFSWIGSENRTSHTYFGLHFGFPKSEPHYNFGSVFSYSVGSPYYAHPLALNL